MNTVLFDTLKMVETLQAGGFTDQQDRAMTSAPGDAATIAAVATRSDVMDLGIGMKHDFEDFRTEVKHDFAALKTEVKHDFDALKHELKHDLDAFRTGLKHDFAALKTEMKHDLAVLEQRMTIRLRGMLVVLAGVMSAAVHYLR